MSILTSSTQRYFFIFRFDTFLIDISLFAFGQCFYRFSRVSALLWSGGSFVSSTFVLLHTGEISKAGPISIIDMRWDAVKTETIPPVRYLKRSLFPPNGFSTSIFHFALRGIRFYYSLAPITQSFCNYTTTFRYTILVYENVFCMCTVNTSTRFSSLVAIATVWKLANIVQG